MKKKNINKKDCIVVLVTTSSKEEAEKIASALLEERLIACANILPAISSIFKWEGKICREQEVMLIIKTLNNRLEEVTNQIKKLHSYQVPEIISLPVINGNKDYLDWVRESTGADGI